MSVERQNDGSEKPRKRAAVVGAGVQYAALPYRRRDGLELLLITSRETGRWVLPKGWPIKGKKAHSAAAREALEEAGLKGKVGKRAVGAYSYSKRLSNGAVLACTVEVYPLAVQRQVKQWPEKGQRRVEWFSPRDAADRVDEPELAYLIEDFAANWAA
jgi:8-oxo-dGTP pyrophosphatase MutT (NUDIX family)